ncbi:MAG TPA: hypothetical protein VIE65_07010 [Methylobacter sp.]|jgi:hypothetical protein
MKLSQLDQVSIGLWLSLAVGMGITSQSMAFAIAPLIAGMFFMTPSFALRAIRVQRPIIKSLGKFVMLMWILLVIFSGLEFIERLYVVNGSSYPKWLATAELDKSMVGWKNLMPLHDRECNHQPFEIYEKANGQYVLRCGLAWHESKTYIANFDPLPPGK